MLNRIAVVAGVGLLLTSVLLCAPASLGASKVEELFALTERLEAAQPWTLEKIERITGRRLQRGSFTSWGYQDNADTLLREIGVETNPLEPEARRITGLSLYLPHNGLQITVSDITKKFGKWTKKENRRTWGSDYARTSGYGSSVSYAYRQKNRRWLEFEVDDDAAKQLRVIHIMRPN